MPLIHKVHFLIVHHGCLFSLQVRHVNQVKQTSNQCRVSIYAWGLSSEESAFGTSLSPPQLWGKSAPSWRGSKSSNTSPLADHLLSWGAWRLRRCTSNQENLNEKLMIVTYTVMTWKWERPNLVLSAYVGLCYLGLYRAVNPTLGCTVIFWMSFSLTPYIFKQKTLQWHMTGWIGRRYGNELNQSECLKIVKIGGILLGATNRKWIFWYHSEGVFWPCAFSDNT